MPRRRPIISRVSAHQAHDVLLGVATGQIVGEGAHTRSTAAERLLKLYQTQQRYGLETQKTPQDFERQLQYSPSENVRNLDALTPEALAELQRTMTADFPGRSKPV